MFCRSTVKGLNSCMQAEDHHPGVVCGRKYYTALEDRPVEKEVCETDPCLNSSMLYLL